MMNHNTDEQTPTQPLPSPRREFTQTTSDFLGRHPLLRRMLVMLSDTLVLALALVIAYEIGFDFRPKQFTPAYHLQIIYILPFLVFFRLYMLRRLGVYRGFARYTSINELISIIMACAAGTLLLTAFNILCNYIPSLDHYPLHPSGEHILRVPKSIVLIDGMLSIMAIGGVHLFRRLVAERLIGIYARGARRVVIVGAGHAGEQVARDLLRNHRDQFDPVAFVDPDAGLRWRRIHGLPVAGTLQELETVTRNYRADMVVIALPKPTPSLMRDLVDHCQRARVQFQIVPDLDSVMRGHIRFSSLRPVEIEDLLGRSPIVLGSDLENSILRGRRVLVTGAGGSIGSELCRQVLAHHPASLTMLGRGENSVFEINEEMAVKARALGVPLEVIIGDVRDATLVRPLFQRLRPQVILHAAAHKHVHFMEAQPAEAIKNNVTGTRTLAEAALEVEAERFILISTDKAVHPIGIMGASKRVTEIIVSAMNGRGKTRFVAVRFGNVLGSRGSVIPLFHRQIAAGGPVTVTHPEVTRYFMTIPEAVSLVLEAGAQGQGGEVFLLDMGQPVKIVDLARNLITLSGLEPGRDIQIKFTGLRPGEKLFEELFTDKENYTQTGHSKIMRCKQSAQNWIEVGPKIHRLEELAWNDDRDAIRAMLAQIIPDYRDYRDAEPAQGPQAETLTETAKDGAF